MAEYNFKNLSDVDITETVPDDANIIGINNGAVFQAPVASIISAPMVIDLAGPDVDRSDPVYGDSIKNAILKGTPIWIYTHSSTSMSGDTWRYAPIIAFQLSKSTTGECYLSLFYHAPGTDGTLKQASLSITITA